MAKDLLFWGWVTRLFTIGVKMRLTKAGEYAIRCALFLSFQGMGVVVSKKEIARAMDIPAQFLGKIAQQLARAGIIEIVQGSKGGYGCLFHREN